MIKAIRNLTIATGALILMSSSCEDVTQVVVDTADTVLNGSGEGSGDTAPALTNEDVIAGLKEALSKGTNLSSETLMKTDGFWKSDRFRIPFPAEAQKVKDKALEWGLDGQVEKFEMTLNRAAEDACTEAKPIFLSAITNMTIADGFTILKGPDNAATNYLRDKTSGELKSAFQPKVQAAIEKVELTKYWEPIINKYNAAMKITGGEQLNPDLEDYITDRAMVALFALIEDEEKHIRQDPVARTTELLQRVFGAILD